MSNPELIKKLKEVISKSGFPLEMKIGNILEENNWDYYIGEMYEDFETGKYREGDITASKTINSIYINIYIECKKSSDKHLILYAPDKDKTIDILQYSFKAFPKVYKALKQYTSLNKIARIFSGLPYFDKMVPVSKNFLMTNGKDVSHDNVSYYSAINGMIKKSIHDVVPLIDEPNYRNISFHVLVFDGYMFQLSNSKTEDFELLETEYGQLDHITRYVFEPHYHDIINNKLVLTEQMYGPEYLIEIMTPEHFTKYIQKLEAVIQQIDPKQFTGWGEAWPE